MKLRDACHRWATFEHDGESVELHLAPLSFSERATIMGFMVTGSFEESSMMLLARGVHDWKGVVDKDGEEVKFAVEVANIHFGAEQGLSSAFYDWLLREHGFSKDGTERSSDPSKTSSGKSEEGQSPSDSQAT